jgi:hypothetical protein
LGKLIVTSPEEVTGLRVLPPTTFCDATCVEISVARVMAFLILIDLRPGSDVAPEFANTRAPARAPASAAI